MGAVAITINLNPATVAEIKAKGTAPFLQRWRGHLRRTFGHVPAYALALDTDWDGRLHFHGAIVAAPDQLPAIRAAARGAGGRWANSFASNRQVKTDELTDATGWASYCTRNRKRLQHVPGDSLAWSRGLGQQLQQPDERAVEEIADTTGPLVQKLVETVARANKSALVRQIEQAPDTTDAAKRLRVRVDLENHPCSAALAPAAGAAPGPVPDPGPVPSGSAKASLVKRNLIFGQSFRKRGLGAQSGIPRPSHQTAPTARYAARMTQPTPPTCTATSSRPSSSTSS